MREDKQCGGVFLTPSPDLSFNPPKIVKVIACFCEEVQTWYTLYNVFPLLANYLSLIN